jgi:DNA invertase Pin-like site-specific DNA recombinase
MPQKPVLSQGLFDTGHAIHIDRRSVTHAFPLQDQNPDLRRWALKTAGCRKILQEKASGASRARPEFQRLLDQLRQGDVVVVRNLDRLARSTRHLLETMQTIREEAVARLKSMSEPWADTTTLPAR